MRGFEIVAGKLMAEEIKLKNQKQLVSLLKEELDTLAGNERKIEGTLQMTGSIYKVKVSRKITREFSPEKYLKLKAGIPENFDPIKERDIYDKGRYKVSLKDLRVLEKVDPVLVAEFITTKPATTTVTVERI